MQIKVNNKLVNIRTGGYLNDSSKSPTLLLIHGAGMNGTVWQMQTRYLANRNINTLAIDLPGHGSSEGQALSSIVEMSNWIIEVIDTLKISSVVIAGHSMGSLIAMEAAKIDNKRIKSIALIGTASLMPVHPDLISAAANNLNRAAKLITDWSFGTNQHLGNHPLPGYWMIDSSIQLIMQSNKGVLAKDLIACNNYKDALSVANILEQKVIIISGREDKMTPTKKAMELSKIISKSEMIIIENAGHMMMIEKPVEITKIIHKLFN